MKKHILAYLLVATALLTGCDYNDKYFDGYDDNPITDVAQYEGDFIGTYPSEGYFSDKVALGDSLNSMLSSMILYADKGYSAKVNVLYADITKGLEKADVSYTLSTEDYDAMGEESGQPGKYNNFDSNMDVDAYLKAFCTEKYADLESGKTITITYKFYSGGVSMLTKTYEKTADGWSEIEMEAFVADSEYTLTNEDYDSMGTESGQPGKYNNFDSGMDVNFYNSTFLKQKFAYATSGNTCKVTYKYYSGSVSDRSTIYKYNGTSWMAYDPYADVIEVSTKIAEVTYNGSTWVLERLLGGVMRVPFAKEDYEILLKWSQENKPAYKSTKYPDTEEYYFGVSTYYPNINNYYSTWKSYYNIDGEYDGKTDEEVQEIMDERLAWGIAHLVLPARITNPDSGLSYIVIYDIYKGRGDGSYAMSFMYNDKTSEFEKISGPVAH